MSRRQETVDNDVTVEFYMRMANLDALLDTYLLEDERNWNDILSPGEQQLVSFARLFYHRPSFAILDEATSSLPEDMEDVLYKQCLQLGITLLSVGHRASLQSYHNAILQLDSKHINWKLSPLSGRVSNSNSHTS